MSTAAEGIASADAVHYLPIASTLICAAFVIVLVRRAGRRRWAPHLVWWAIGVFFYGLGTALESIITLNGNTPTLNQLWYWAGAILGGYPLATGSLYLLARRRLAHVCTAASLGLVVFASVIVFLAPVDAAADGAVRPSGQYIAEDWQWVRLLTPFINGYAAVFLIGGAAFSSWRFAFPERDKQTGAVAPRNLPRATGTGLIALGALLPGIGGGFAKGGYTEALYVGEFVGIILIWIGYELCLRAPRPVSVSSASSSDANTAALPASSGFRSPADAAGAPSDADKVCLRVD